MKFFASEKPFGGPVMILEREDGQKQMKYL